MSAQPKIYPEWQAHAAEHFDAEMAVASSKAMNRLREDSEYRKGLIRDPRPVHRELYLPFVPKDYPEYAGTFRGEKNSALESRESGSPRFLSEGPLIPFVAADQVAASMIKYQATILEGIAGATESNKKGWAAVAAFVWFGQIHPFLDGNGHIQRLIFAAVCLECGLILSDRWTMHPRPYDRLLSIALERSQIDNAEMGLVAEYLGFFVEPRFFFLEVVLHMQLAQVIAFRSGALNDGGR